MPPEPPDTGDADLATLRLIYQELLAESNRLRDARRETTAGLGPLPASAAVVVGVLAGFQPQDGSPAYLILFAFGLIPFVLILVLSSLGSRRTPYRISRGWEEWRLPEEVPSERAWLIERIEEEHALCFGRHRDALAQPGVGRPGPSPSPLRRLAGRVGREWQLGWPDPHPAGASQSLVEAFEAERRSLRFVQALVGLEVLYLVAVTLIARGAA